MKESGRRGQREKDSKNMGKLAPMGEAMAQIKKGGRALVREVKSFFPEPEELDDLSLREALEEMEERILEEDLEGALERLERGLAPILAGPGFVAEPERKRRRLRGEWLFLGALGIGLLAAWLLARV